jgi:hypothetical protein
MRFCLDHLNCDKMAEMGKQKSRVGGDNSHVVFGQKSLGDKGGVGRCVTVVLQPVILSPMVSCSRREISQKYAELTVWPARTNPLWTIPLMSKKIMNMLLTLRFTCLAFFFFVSVSLDFPRTAHASFPERLSNQY